MLATLILAAQVTLTGPAKVHDGDTLTVQGERVRLWGIDAPELRQPCQDGAGRTYQCGERSRDLLAALVANREVSCAYRDWDRYGRFVGQCSVGGLDLGERMVATGQAVAFTRYTDRYAGMEAAARRSGAGLWEGRFELPSDWRRDSRGGR
jgi:endonuclease YncB( thermonuclease family)